MRYVSWELQRASDVLVVDEAVAEADAATDRIVGTLTTTTAATLGCPPGTIRQRRNRAEAQLATWARQAA